jgi:hypothetical protein
MRKFVLMAMLLCFAGAAFATDWEHDEKWKGPGWYIIVSSLMAETIDQGPFANEDACKAAMPSEEYQDEMFDEIGMTMSCKQLP